MKEYTNKKGITLVEILIYTAIFTIFITGASSIAISMKTSRIGSQVQFEVNDQGNNAVNVMMQAVRNASDLSMPAVNSSGQSLILNMYTPAISPTSFSVTNGTLFITEGGSPSVALTNSKVIVDSLIFTNLATSSKPGTVKVELKLSSSASSTKNEDRITQNFYGSASIRK